MEWTQGKIYTTTAGQEIAGAILIGADVQGYSILDAEDFNEFLEGTELYWDYIEEELMEIKNCETTLTFYIPKNKQGEQMLNDIKNGLQTLKKEDKDRVYGRLDLECESVQDDDWADGWKKYFKPLPVGKKLLILPSWESTDNEENRIILEIDPASAFGTGKHETTKLCLELIEQTVEKNDTVLDIGCGSGILSIAALLLGAKSAVGVDIDENAAKTAKENAEKNGLGTRFASMWGDPVYDSELYSRLSGNKYNIICANIVADVLISLSPILPALFAENGVLIASGIIEERLPEVARAFEKQGIIVKQKKTERGWCALLCKIM